MNFFQETFDALFVDAFRDFQDFKVHTYRRGKVNECLNVLRKAKAAKTQSGLEELRANARVKAHSVRHFLNVCADSFAKVSDHIGVTDLQRQERVGSVLDELRAI